MAEIEERAVEAANAQWRESTKKDEDVLDSFPVSVMETGTSAIAGQCFFPASLASLTPEEFQAREVVRRLGGALASGARLVGWHSWMAGDTAQFAGHGLREDTQAEDAPAFLAEQRLSWFAFQRLASLLGHTESGGMVLPSVTNRADLRGFLISPRRHPFVVFRYEGSFLAPGLPGHQYRLAWLALRDPAMLEVVPGLHLFAEETSAGAGKICQVPILDPFVSPIHAAPTTGLPLRETTYPTSTALRLPSWVEFLADPTDPPVLLLSDVEINWKVESGFTPTPP